MRTRGVVFTGVFIRNLLPDDPMPEIFSPDSGTAMKNLCSITALLFIAFFGDRVSAGVIGFDIQLSYSGFTASQQAIFEAAAQTWESHIIGYEDTVSSTVVSITAQAAAIDGVGGVLGSAGPQTAKLGTELNYLYTETGAMQFDSADIASLETAGTLSDVILHEMGHVLGIGSLWSSSAVGFAGFQELYVAGSGEYTGANALAAWQSEFNQPTATFVPVELGGGAGTADGHWNEVDGGGSATGFVSNITGQDFQNELMTGWLGGSTFISTVTLGGFADLGYTMVPEPGQLVLITAFTAVGIFRIRRSRKAVS